MMPQVQASGVNPYILLAASGGITQEMGYYRLSRPPVPACLNALGKRADLAWYLGHRPVKQIEVGMP